MYCWSSCSPGPFPSVLPHSSFVFSYFQNGSMSQIRSVVRVVCFTLNTTSTCHYNLFVMKYKQINARSWKCMYLLRWVVLTTLLVFAICGTCCILLLYRSVLVSNNAEFLCTHYLFDAVLHSLATCTFILFVVVSSTRSTPAWWEKRFAFHYFRWLWMSALLQLTNCRQCRHSTYYFCCMNWAAKVYQAAVLV